MPRRVLHVFSTFDLGGPEARFVSMVPKLGPSFEHTVLAMDGRYGAADFLQADNVKLLKIPVKKAAGAPNFRAFRQVLRDLKPNQLVTYNFGAFEWIFSNIGLGIAHAHIEEGFGADESVKRNWKRNLTRRIGLAVSQTQLVTVSNALEVIARREWGASPSRLSLIPNGVNLAQFKDVGQRGRPSKFAMHQDEIVIGTVAGLRPIKRIDRLIDAFALLRNETGNARPLRLVIVGDGPLRSDLERQARRLAIDSHMTFTGRLNDIHNVVSEFDLYSLSSDSEQMPVSVLEAMAAGLPVVSTNVGDVGSMLSEQNQPQLCALNERALSQAMLSFVALPPTMLSTGRANREKVARDYTEKRMLEGWTQLFNGMRV
jgi:glycosyltransferase involved in cell wall biosynthesis